MQSKIERSEEMMRQMIGGFLWKCSGVWVSGEFPIEICDPSDDQEVYRRVNEFVAEEYPNVNVELLSTRHILVSGLVD